MGRIKKEKPQQGSLVKSVEPPNYDQKPPIFSLEKLQSGKYCLSELDQENKAMFADAIFRRKNLTWNDIKKADRHGLGTEKIAKNAINAPIPKFITEDMDTYLVFRYHGLRPMVGYRQRDVFYVLWFDSDFTLYAH
ncbi:hypothetical protein EOE67_08735 [Rheinheimera riviphila]|uniref:Uncharacterized protein n=1 Tax=Rheinheimera riviphila TaxID=1834037 RepID=A0A437QZU8_9GAMM|nr:hypothetical protein [Rheinheimera riviphila]RVU39983.1 hypothetical protein EOE67_08735 [Rheinheimera riviphila]